MVLHVRRQQSKMQMCIALVVHQTGGMLKMYRTDLFLNILHDTLPDVRYTNNTPIGSNAEHIVTAAKYPRYL